MFSKVVTYANISKGNLETKRFHIRHNKRESIHFEYLAAGETVHKSPGARGFPREFGRCTLRVNTTKFNNVTCILQNKDAVGSNGCSQQHLYCWMHCECASHYSTYASGFVLFILNILNSFQVFAYLCQRNKKKHSQKVFAYCFRHSDSSVSFDYYFKVQSFKMSWIPFAKSRSVEAHTKNLQSFLRVRVLYIWICCLSSHTEKIQLIDSLLELFSFFFNAKKCN